MSDTRTESLQMTPEISAAAEHWFDDVRAVPVSVLRFGLVSRDRVRIRSGLGSKLNGAIWHGLADVGENNPHAELRYNARELMSLHDARQAAPGLSERPFVLRIPEQSISLQPGEPLPFEMIAFGPAAHHWRTFVWAFSEEIKLGRYRFGLQTASVATCEGFRDVFELDYVEDGMGTLGHLTSSVPLPGTDTVRLQFRSPVRLSHENEPVTDLDSFEPVMVAVLVSLSTVARTRPAKDVWKALRSLAAETLVHGASTRNVEAFHHRSRQREEDYRQCGLVGHIEFTPASPHLLYPLAVAQFTHIGQASAFGLGRYRLEEVSDEEG